ncbi:hypothetical protein N9N28_02975 [Rubripirellula amarantea]|nr:hypothetical protein [Rubripirellula amarantea]
MLLAAIAVAIAITVARPFDPTITLRSLTPEPVAPPFDHDGRRQQFSVVVRNDGYLPVWLDPGDTQIPDQSWGMNPKLGYPAFVDIEIWKEDCTKLAPGEDRAFTLVVLKKYNQFRLGVVARDWRGRDGFKFLGYFDNISPDGGEPSDAPESPSRAF